jgi:hypothetical protein
MNTPLDRITYPLEQQDSSVVVQALTEFTRRHREIAETMNALHAVGDNGLVTAQGAKHLADEHLMLSLKAGKLTEQIQDNDRRLAFIEENV